MLGESDRKGVMVPRVRKINRKTSIYTYPLPECECIFHLSSNFSTTGNIQNLGALHPTSNLMTSARLQSQSPFDTCTVALSQVLNVVFAIVESKQSRYGGDFYAENLEFTCIHKKCKNSSELKEVGQTQKQECDFLYLIFYVFVYYLRCVPQLLKCIEIYITLLKTFICLNCLETIPNVFTYNF